MKICIILLILLSVVNNNAFAQGTAVLSYGYPVTYQPYYVAPATPVPCVVPVIGTGYYAVPVTSYQYVPYQYVAATVTYYPPVVRVPYGVTVERRGCFGYGRYYRNYGVFE